MGWAFHTADSPLRLEVVAANLRYEQCVQLVAMTGRAFFLVNTEAIESVKINGTPPDIGLFGSIKDNKRRTR